MTDMATEFAALTPDQQTAYATGATRAYQQVMDAIAAAFGDPAGLTAAFTSVRDQYYQAVTMFKVEGTL